MTQANITKFESSRLVNKFNDVSNLTHPNPTTFFATAEGVGKAFVEARFEEETEVNTLTISLQRGHERKTCFAVLYIDSKEIYKRVEPSSIFVSSGETQNRQDFSFKKVKAKGVRLVFLGNSDNQQPYKSNVPSPQITPTGRDIDVGPNKQIFSIRKLSVSFTDESEDVVKREEDKLEKREEKLVEEDSECESCQWCGNSDKGSLKGGVCQVCKNICHLSHERLQKEFPQAWNNLCNNIVYNQNNTGARISTISEDNDLGIKGSSRNRNANANMNRVSIPPISHPDPMLSAMGHTNPPNRDNYTDLSTTSQLKTPQERPQIIFKDPVIRGSFVPSATGERLDQNDNNRNVISSITPTIRVPNQEETDAIVANRKKTEEYRAGRPNGDLNINVRSDVPKAADNKQDNNNSKKNTTNNKKDSDDDEKEVEFEDVNDVYTEDELEDIEREGGEKKKTAPVKSNKQSNNKDKKEEETKPIVSPIPVKNQANNNNNKDNNNNSKQQDKDDSTVKVVKEKEVKDEQLDPDIAKTFDDFLKDKNEDKGSEVLKPEESWVQDTHNFNDLPLDTDLNTTKNPLEAPGKASSTSSSSQEDKSKDNNGKKLKNK